MASFWLWKWLDFLAGMDYMFTFLLLLLCVVRMIQGSNDNIFVCFPYPPYIVCAMEYKEIPHMWRIFLMFGASWKTPTL